VNPTRGAAGLRNAAACAVLLLCFGCQGSILVDTEKVPPLPSPEEAPDLYLPYSPTEYRLSVDDRIELRSYYDPQLDQQMTIRADGRISLLLIGDLHVEGLTIAEVEERVVEEYARKLDSPEVSIILQQASSRRVFISGQIKAPSMQPLTGPLTIIQAVSLAGGFLDTANMKQVLLLRPDGIGGHRVRTVDVKAILSNQSQDVFLRSHDVVYVPRSFISNVNLFVDQWINKMIPEVFKVNVIKRL